MEHTVRASRRRPKRASTVDVERLATGELLSLHERHFGPLDPPSKRRMVGTAVANGWDRRWDAGGLAA